MLHLVDSVFGLKTTVDVFLLHQQFVLYILSYWAHLFVQIHQVFNEDTDILYTVNKAGPFTSDSLELRKCHVTRNFCAIAAKSINYSDVSISRTYYRIYNMTLQSILQSLLHLKTFNLVKQKTWIENEDLLEENKKQKEFIVKTTAMLDESLKILQSDDWKLEKQADNGDELYSKLVPGVGTVWKIKSIVKAPVNFIKNEIFQNVENTPSWHSTNILTRRLKVLGNEADIVYTVNKSGIFTSDLLELRKCISTRNFCMVTGRSVEYVDTSVNRTYYRVQSHINCWSMKEEGKQCVLQGIVAVNSNFWCPSSLSNKLLSDNLFLYVKHIQERAKKLQEQF